MRTARPWLWATGAICALLSVAYPNSAFLPKGLSIGLGAFLILMLAALVMAERES